MTQESCKQRMCVVAAAGVSVKYCSTCTKSREIATTPVSAAPHTTMHVIFVKKKSIYLYARVEEMKSFYGWHGNILHGWMNSTSSYIDLDFLLFGFSGLREEAFLCVSETKARFSSLFFNRQTHRHRAIIYTLAKCQITTRVEVITSSSWRGIEEGVSSTWMGHDWFRS